MYAIVEETAYFVDDSTGYKVTFDVDGQMQIDESTTISITTQKLYRYDEMCRKMNVKASVKDARKTYILTNANSTELSHFYDNVVNATKGSEAYKKVQDAIYSSVVEIENRLDDCVITFDKNGGTGTMAEVRKEVGEKYTLPTCGFTPPEGKRFKEWKIGNTSYDVGDEITLTESITVKATYENIPEYTISFDANGGTGTMESVTKLEGEKYELPASTFTAPENKQFKDWLIGDVEYEVGAEITVEDNTTIKAEWENIPEPEPTG